MAKPSTTWHWLKTAFAVRSPEEPLTDSQQRLIHHLATEVVRRRLSVPALAALEMSRPLSYLGSQAMHFFQPMVSAFAGTAGYQDLAKIFERRDGVDLLAQAIEAAERESDSASPGEDRHPH
ncbi:MAG: hypothetical protein KDA80_15790 [Planctomycetaceae bacterium]|nr:hypothetical protein [Planctomycetaceae bacterium]